MWAIVAIFLCIIVLLWSYMAMAARDHERKEKERIYGELKEAEQRLKVAIAEHCDDFDLHAALRREVLRLRKLL